MYKYLSLSSWAVIVGLIGPMNTYSNLPLSSLASYSATMVSDKVKAHESASYDPNSRTSSELDQKSKSIPDSEIGSLFTTFASSKDKYIVEAGIANFLLHDKAIEKIYSGPKAEYSVAISKRFSTRVESWLSISYAQKPGASLGLSESCHFKLIPLSAGLKYIYRPSYRVETYLGAGLSLAQLKLRNQSPITARSASSVNFGSLLKMGARYQLDQRWFIGVFADYAFLKFRFKNLPSNLDPHDVRMGGLRCGVCLGTYL